MRIIAFAVMALLAWPLAGACQTTRTVPNHHRAVPQNKPSEKEVIYLLMQSWNVKLTVDASCNGVGTDATDSTIGQYMAGFWQYQGDTGASQNRLSVQVVPGEDPGIRTAYWKAIVMIGGVTENEPWNWGVSFGIRASDKTVIRNSFRCLGGG